MPPMHETLKFCPACADKPIKRRKSTKGEEVKGRAAAVIGNRTGQNAVNKLTNISGKDAGIFPQGKQNQGGLKSWDSEFRTTYRQ
jgi:hypothetical protein